PHGQLHQALDRGKVELRLAERTGVGASPAFRLECAIKRNALAHFVEAAQPYVVQVGQPLVDQRRRVWDLLPRQLRPEYAIRPGALEQHPRDKLRTVRDAPALQPERAIPEILIRLPRDARAAQRLTQKI